MPPFHQIKMLVQFMLLFNIVMLPSQSSLAAALTDGWHESNLVQGSLTREFKYYLPSHSGIQQNSNIEKQSTIKFPLVILLHGGTQSMDKLFNKYSGASKQWPLLAEQKKFVLIVPNGTNPKTLKGSGNKQNWNDCRHTKPGERNHVSANDVDFISQLIDWSVANLSVNPSEVFVTGASNGGLMTFRIAQEIPKKITAAAAFIANMPLHSECKPPQEPIPMLIMNSTDDPFMPWLGGEIKSHGGSVLSARETYDFWTTLNRSNQKTVENIVFADSNGKDHSTVTGKCFTSSALKHQQSAKTCVYTIVGGGHVAPSVQHDTPKWMQKRILGWQNKDIESADVAWRFFTELLAR
jgi:polyhydroxybutyrate depolymerase